MKKKHLDYANVFYIVTLIYTIFCIIFFQSFPVFGDGARYSNLIKENTNRSIIDFSFSDYPPLYIFLSSVLNQLLNNVELTTTLLNVVPISLAVLFLFYLLKMFFNERISFWSSLITLFSPMFLWTIVHRLMDPLSFLLMILSFFVFFKSHLNLKLLPVFLILIYLLPLSKQTTFIVLAMMLSYCLIRIIYLFFKQKKLFLSKEFIFIITIPLFFSLGIATYYKPYISTLNKLPFFEIQNPNHSPEIILKYLNNFQLNTVEKVNLRYVRKNNSIPYFFDLLKNKEFISAIQYFSVMPTSTFSNKNWYSPASIHDDISLLFLLIFLIGIAMIILNYKKNNYTLLVFSSLFILYPFYKNYALVRYLFIVSIIYSIFFGLGIEFINKLLIKSHIKKTHKYVVNILFQSLILSLLTLVFITTLFNLNEYRNSYGHIKTKSGGVSELNQLSEEYPDVVGSIIFTPATEPIYYLDSEVIWSWKMFLLNDETQVITFFDEIGVKYLIIPHFSYSNYGYLNGKQVSNTVSNMVSSKLIPMDSTFNKMLNDGYYFKKLKQYKAFTLYEKM